MKVEVSMKTGVKGSLGPCNHCKHFENNQSLRRFENNMIAWFTQTAELKMRAQEAKENNQDVTVATEVREDVAAMDQCSSRGGNG